MKKLLTVLVCTVLTLSCIGCNNVQTAPAASAPPAVPSLDTQPSTEAGGSTEDIPVQDIPQLPLTAVSLPMQRESAAAENGTVIFEYTYQNISLLAQDAEVADVVILDLLNRIDATRSDAMRIMADAQAAYTASADWIPYIYTVTYNPTRIDQGVLSLFGEQVSLSGSSHPSHTGIAVSYDLVSGEVLSLADILDESAPLNQLGFYMGQALVEAAGTSGLYENYASIVEDLLTYDLLETDGWFFTDTGLCFYFSPYEIAAYSAGTVFAEIPYEKLVGLLKDEYYPTEEVQAFGSISASLFTDSDLEQYQQFSEAVLDADGESILLHTDGIVYDIRIEQGTWSLDGVTFTPSCVVFAADNLTPQDAVMVQTYIPDGAPNLRLTYRSSEEVVTVYITQSGEDGSILLIKN